MQTLAAGQESVDAGGLSNRTNTLPTALMPACQVELELSIVCSAVFVATVAEVKVSVQNFSVPEVELAEPLASPATYIVFLTQAADEDVNE